MADYLKVFGHGELARRLATAVAAERLPQSLILQGPRGVGKQRLALWTAAALNCSGASERPCGDCQSCRLAARLEHPDIHWFFPLPRPKRVSGADKLEAKLEEARAEALNVRRSNTFYLDEAEEATGIYVGAVGTMRRLAQFTPAMGPWKVLIIGRAEALIPQMGSEEAANALLKLLEEPPADTTLILTSDMPGALLPTIRSRVQALRVPPLNPDQVAEFLVSQLELPIDESRALAAISAGSIGRAIAAMDETGTNARQGAIRLIRALLDGRQSARLAAAHAYRGVGARGAFSRVLTEMVRLLRDLLAASTGAEAAVVDDRALAALSEGEGGGGGGGPAEPERLLGAIERVEEMRLLADRNVNPQLIVANLLAEAGVSK